MSYNMAGYRAQKLIIKEINYVSIIGKINRIDIVYYAGLQTLGSPTPTGIFVEQ